MKKHATLYVLILVLSGLGIVFIMQYGRMLQHPNANARLPQLAESHGLSKPDTPVGIWSTLDVNLREPLSRLFLQLIVILIATRLVGSLFTKIGQPSVVGE